MDCHNEDRLAENFFDVVLRKIKECSNVYLTTLMMGLILLLGANIAMRYLLGQPISWSNSIARYIYIHIVLLGSAISYMMDGHAKIESFYSKMPPSIRYISDLIHYLVVMALSALLVINGIKYAISMWGVNSPVLMNFPMGIVYLAVPAGFAITFLFLFRQLLLLCLRK